MDGEGRRLVFLYSGPACVGRNAQQQAEALRPQKRLNVSCRVITGRCVQWRRQPKAEAAAHSGWHETPS